LCEADNIKNPVKNKPGLPKALRKKYVRIKFSAGLLYVKKIEACIDL